ncbi:hypothetical protein KEHDKFFH_02290 [Marinobacter maroccanus]|uniref:Uncharacterized protein n=1 Tax=Marinobacter maroccanus TaxID=2055143 RepID=A0A2S5ZFL0_9GAMM|nr:hypothetical protein [Marinobacter maroccanus]PPI86169.1 hypothetical protein KEHDKFFH_02290 [Marinobacter maroccanus]
MSLKLFEKAYLYHITYSKLYAEIHDPNEADRGGRVLVEGDATPSIEDNKLVFDVVLSAAFYPKDADVEDEDSVVAEAEICAKAIFHADREFGDEESAAIDGFSAQQRHKFSDRHFAVVETVLMSKLKALMSDLQMPLGIPFQLTRS